MSHLFSEIIKGNREHRQAAFKRAADTMTSFLDNIKFDGNVWKDVERRKWNSAFGLQFYGEESCDFLIEPSSAIRTGEKRIDKDDFEMWSKQWRLDDVKRFIRVNMPILMS